MNKLSKSTVLLAVALILCVAFIFAKFSFPPVINVSEAGKDTKNTVSTNGDAIISVVPDMAVITLGVENQNKNLQKAYAENKAKMNVILKELEKLGVDKKDIKTDQFNVNPSYDWSNNTNRITGYQISNTVTVNVRKIDDTGKILESAVLNQSNAIRGIGFKIADDSKAYQDALKQALKNAEDKAKVIAGGNGEKKLTLLSVKENTANNPEPVYTEMKTRNEAAGAPVQTGTQEVHASVIVEFGF